MAKNWNRKTRRELGRYGIGQKIIAQAVDNSLDKVREDTRRDAYNNAFAAMLLALHQIHGFGYQRVRRVAIKTLNNINSTFCASELIEMLKAATGFDVEEPIMEDELGMEVE